MNIEIAYKIEEMKKAGASDREIGRALGISERAIFFTRKTLGIRSGKRFRVEAAEGTAAEIGYALRYTSSAVRKWPELKNPPYRVERVE